MSLENLEIIDSGTGSGLTMSPEMQAHLKEICKWSRFLAILGFIFIGLSFIIMLLAGGTMATLMASSGVPGMAAAGPLITIISLALIALYIIPVLYLYKFSGNTKKGLQSVSQEMVDLGITNFRKFWKFIGVFTIGFIILYFVLMIGGLAAVFASQ